MRAVVALLGRALLGRALLSSLAVSAGCQSSSSPPPPPAASAPAATATRLAGSAAPSVEPAHIQLPRSPDTPVRPTRRPLDPAVLGRLAAIEFPDFVREDHGTAAGVVQFRHTTRSRPHLAVSIAVGPCSARRACEAMDLARWSARQGELRGQLPDDLRDRPDTRFEIRTRAIAGAPAIATYQLGHAGGVDDRHQPSADDTDAYVLYYNDGINQIRVMAQYADDAVASIGQLLAIAPPDDLERLAVAFASFYLHAWQ